MKIKKRLINYLCAAMIIFNLSACVGTNTNQTPPPTEDNTIVTTITPKPIATPETTPEATTDPQQTSTPEPTVEFTPDPEPVVTLGPDSYISVEGFDDRGTSFTLTEDEQQLFEQYAADLDISILKDVPPVSIAKIFIQCGIEGLWQAEYALFAEKGLHLTKTEYQEEHVRDIIMADISSRKSKADIVFPFLQDGVFTETEDGFGEIEFSQFNGDPAKFHLMKNKDGIWLVKFNPFDQWEQE